MLHVIFLNQHWRWNPCVVTTSQRTVGTAVGTARAVPAGLRPDGHARSTHALTRTGRWGIVFFTVWMASLFLLTIPSYAQHTVSGVVRDAETDESLISATVRLSEDGRIVTTDEQGRFVFDDVNAGPKTIVVTYIGYRNF